eukprot:6752005-Pyramimonas_sp.AAC.1
MSQWRSPELPPASDAPAQFYICVPLPAGTLTRADTDAIEAETGCRARVRDRHDGRGRMFTLRGPPQNRERAYLLCQEAIAANGLHGGRVPRHVQAARQQQHREEMRQRRYSEYWRAHEQAQAAYEMANAWAWQQQ